MNSADSAHGDRFKLAIETFLNSLSKAKWSSDSPVHRIMGESEENDGDVRVIGYIHDDDMVFEEGRSIIVLPTGPDVTLQEGLTLIRKHQTASNCNRIYFVDCYSICNNRETEKGRLTPEELWDHFFGGRLRPVSAKYVDKHHYLLRDIENKYGPRKLQLIRPSAHPDTNVSNEPTIIPMRGTAQGALRAWAFSTHSDFLGRLLVFGEAGLGKTWLLCRFAQEQKRASDEHSPWLHPVPIYVDLSFVKDELLMGTGLDSLLSKHILLNGYAPRVKGGISTIEALIGSGLVVLLLDEFDTITQQFNEAIVEHHIGLVLQNLPLSARLIVATRSTRFSSRARMLATFTMKGVAGDNSARQVAPDTEGRGTIPFSATTLAQFTDFSDFLSGVPDLPEGADTIPLADLGQGDVRLSEIGGIPRYGDVVRKLLPLTKTTRGERLNNLLVFEIAVLWQLRFNLLSGRAIYEIRYEEFGQPQSEVLDLYSRLKILERIAWFLLEFDRDTIDAEEMKHAIIEYAPTYFEEAINDLKCQTVFEFSDWGSAKLRFRQDVLWVFFAMRRICSLLWRDDLNDEGSEKDEKIGIRSLGSFDTSKIDKKYKFLKSFVKDGFLRVPADQADGPMEAPERRGYWKGKVRKLNIESVLALAKDTIMRERAFSNNTRFLVENLEACGIETSKLTAQDEWCRKLERKQDRKSRENLKKLCTRGIHVHGVQQYQGKDYRIRPFVVAKREVVNWEFSKFLGSYETAPNQLITVPVLRRLDSNWKPLYKGKPLELSAAWRQVQFEDRQPEIIHPLSWEVVHKADEYSVEGDDQWLRRLTNDYHLFDWTDGKMPSGGSERPVVWISSNVAAVYCNWKSRQEKLSLAYRILVRTGDLSSTEDNSATELQDVLVFLNPLADGYRLPFSFEWAFAARANRSADSYPWTGECEPIRQRLKEALISPHPVVLPVTRSYCNDFGVYGMIGNVREWAEDQMLYDDYVRAAFDWQGLVKSGRIMGSTWALGEGTFRYSHPSQNTGMALPRCNTNPDVGFRWARSLLPDDAGLVALEETKKNKLRKEDPKGGTR